MTVGDLVVPAEVALLERALAWTGGRLATVEPRHLALPTPCAGWGLEQLLAHMEDGLDAFSEAAAGFVVPLRPARSPEHPVPLVPVLQAKACALLGSWSRPTLPAVRTGSVHLAAGTLVATAALEITVHGWDVAAAVASDPSTDPSTDPATDPGTPPPLPEDLARALLPIAAAVVAPEDRPHRFGPPLPPASTASYGARLVGFLGRRP
ncbi:MAG: maleylpyruvate isomerase N-terminal domain-containing protein [Nocardioides alkalitolerans]